MGRQTPSGSTAAPIHLPRGQDGASRRHNDALQGEPHGAGRPRNRAHGRSLCRHLLRCGGHRALRSTQAHTAQLRTLAGHLAVLLSHLRNFRIEMDVRAERV